ncbi:hypothetical protein [Nonomuraea jabiensis]|uniref:hypothetical protein n=1 Tax=Nonomuraea jabiensis TaxID=882448 RepID=UPI003D732A44
MAAARTAYGGPYGRILAVASMKADTVDVIDTRTDAKTASVPVGGPLVQAAIFSLALACAARS